MTQRPRSLAEKLERLFETVRPPGGFGRQYTHEEIAQRATEAGGPSISASYIWGLRKDPSKNPTKRALEALAAAFGVSVVYFFDDDVADQIDRDLELLSALRDGAVRDVAVRAAGLSAESLVAITEMIDRAREWEGLGRWEDRQ